MGSVTAIMSQTAVPDLAVATSPSIAPLQIEEPVGGFHHLARTVHLRWIVAHPDPHLCIAQGQRERYRPRERARPPEARMGIEPASAQQRRRGPVPHRAGGDSHRQSRVHRDSECAEQHSPILAGNPGYACFAGRWAAQGRARGEGATVAPFAGPSRCFKVPAVQW